MTSHMCLSSLQCRCYFGMECLIDQVFNTAILNCNWMVDW